MKTSENNICPICGEGSLAIMKREYIAEIGEGQKLRIPNVEMEVCDHCGEEILSLEAARDVDTAIAEHTERLSPEELTAIREEFHVDKTEMSEALGLGGKTYLRWEQGKQYPSRSMGYYLRVLREFPQAFEWVRSRGWRGRNRIATREPLPITDMRHCFPVLAGNPARLDAAKTHRGNPARALLE
jgi:putative zinc finger/helix-turn-helix YgiT family protein